ncbi:hypothetical protein ALC56_14064, partial [Trachymyrmex septentrionalis]
FYRCLRMNSEMFENLLMKVTPFIQKKNTILRNSIPPAERLSLTFCNSVFYISEESLCLNYRIGQSIIFGIIKEVTDGITKALKDEYLRMPSSEDEWRIAAKEFGDRWNFANCFGAVDGNFKIEPPIRSEFLYRNYKDNFSMVLLAFVNANFRIIYADVGTNRRISDAGIWNKSILEARFQDNSLKIPTSSSLSNIEKEFSFVFIGDEGFPLSTNILIPYLRDLCTGRKEKRIFNYR